MDQALRNYAAPDYPGCGGEAVPSANAGTCVDGGGCGGVGGVVATEGGVDGGGGDGGTGSNLREIFL